MPRTLVVTNDFPPRQGGIETFVHAMTSRFDPDDVVVYTSSTPGQEEYDRGLPYPVVRARTRMLLPTPARTRDVVRLVHEHGCDSVWFGAAAPLGLMAPALRRRTAVRRTVATTHGHELWWAKVPGTRAALGRIGRSVDHLTYLSDRTVGVLADAVGPEAAARAVRMSPGVDPETFAGADPAGGRAVRERYGIPVDAPVVLCAARLVERKGQDVLVRALPAVLAAVPDARLLVVGDGPDADRLRRLVAEHGVGAHVVLAGGHPHTAMPAFYAAADVFAMPSRSRRGGLEVEGLGIVYLEAQAAGLPVVVGDSGGAPDAVDDGVTGFVVDGTDPADVAARLVELLGDAALRARLGAAGPGWVRDSWTWDQRFATLHGLLTD
ncbi:phosphatidylinositol alpha-1,6-mannosyltransferase [Isoptericola jiangsuensis]|uniref:D-inositol 3-phosphate glycosyltransferase n=1 Tax=Isoptericola jiangsuensis TaxID=548579 RepID=A0A2A9EX92_9MICO|nr:glycosyltransferase family 4 protein [Isoptericola jiangsuensis]PFG43654.1 phosphatidylinositol alpha-1,6-mannosyltransferase [Isoptericola jiangsuensis]